MSAGRPVQLWDWLPAVQRLVPDDGTRATALAWAIYCWTWRADWSEQRTLREVAAVSLEDFTAAHRVGKSPRTVRRHFQRLVDAGLLELVHAHSRWYPNTYAPRVPQQRPPMASAAAEHRPSVAGVDGQQRPRTAGVDGQHRPLVTTTPATGDRAPFPTEKPETPLPRVRAHGDAGAREGAREGGGQAIDDQRPAAARALTRWRADVGPDIAQRLAAGYEARCVDVVAQLLAAGWSETGVVRETNRRPWIDVQSVGRVLEARLRELLEQEPPASSAWTRPPWCGHCDEATRQLQLDDGAITRCPDCHPLTAGQLEAQVV